MDKDILFDKICGCWLGKNIGGTLGGPFEGRKELMALSFYEPVPKEPLPNDDLDLQLIWLEILKKKGTGLTCQDFVEAWLNNITYNCDEYGVVKANLKMGLKPPVSGYYNNWFAESMGAPIRSEIWAAIAPGKPEVAAYYAYQDACLDHYGDGIYGEIFFAALESAAFINNDLDQVIDIGLSFLPKSSLIYQAVNFVRDLTSKKVSLSESREEILKNFGHFNVTQAVQNIAFTILGLLSGKGDFGKSILNAVNCGYDTDCTAATAGAIMGILLGAKGIPEEWKAPIGKKIKVDARIVGLIPPEDLVQLTKEVISVGETFSHSNLPKLPAPFLLPPKEAISSPPFSLPFLINDKKPITFPDFHFDLNPFFGKTPGKVKLSTTLSNPTSRKVRILPACNDGVTLWLDNKQVLSHHDHTPIRPAPHSTESRFVDVDLSEGKHKIEMEISCCRKPLEFSWIVSDWNDYLLFPLATDLKYNLDK